MLRGNRRASHDFILGRLFYRINLKWEVMNDRKCEMPLKKQKKGEVDLKRSLCDLRPTRLLKVSLARLLGLRQAIQ